MSDEREPLWSDDEIIAAYNNAFDKPIDVHHLAFVRWIRDDLQARIAELEAELATANATLKEVADYHGISPDQL